MLIAGFILGVLLYIIGSVLEKHELAQRDRDWEKRRRR
jgi:hypothetical protein